MIELSKYIKEGFFQNVGLDVESTIDEWWDEFPRKWNIGIYINYDSEIPKNQRTNYSIRYNPNTRCLFLHNEKHKTSKNDIKFDIESEWGNCFSKLWDEVKDFSGRDRGLFISIFTPNPKYRWDVMEVWIHSVSAGAPSGHSNKYVYKVPSRSNTPIFKEIVK